MFLNRVRNERDTGRFEARGEQMMHMEHLADQRRWEETMARDGEFAEVDVGDEDDMLPGMWSGSKGDWALLTGLDEGLDEFVSQEEALEMAWRETQTQAQTQTQRPGRVDQLRGNEEVPFSDDDYDDIFMGLQESQDMDMS